MRYLIAVALLVFAAASATAGETAGATKEKPQNTDSSATFELTRMVAEDQYLRSDAVQDWVRIAEADFEHRERVFELLAAGSIQSPQDLYRASLILQHADPGKCVECYLLAYKLALRAVEMGHSQAKYLAALNIDRYLVFSGKPQKFGTQSNVDSLGNYYLFPVDTLTSDSERAAWGLPSLDELKASLERQKAD